MRGIDVPVGQAFTGTVGFGWNGLFLRTHSGIVTLSSPQVDWIFAAGPVATDGPTIRDYKPMKLKIRYKGAK